MFKKHINAFCLALSLVFSLSFLLAGCGGKTGGGNTGSSTDKSDTGAKKVKIRFVHGFTSGDIFGQVASAAVNEFAEDNKDSFELVQEIAAGDEMKSKIRIDIAGNNIPDAWMYWSTPSDAGSFVKSNILLDVDEYFKVSKNTKWEDYPEGIWESFKINNKYYCIPLDGFIGYWFCNKEIFARYNLQYPKTYEDLLAVSKVLNEHGIVPLAMGSKGGNPGHFFMSELYVQFPNAIKELSELPTTWKFDTEGMRKTCELIADMKKNNVFPSDTIANGDWGPSFALYNEGRAAMIYSMSWMLSSLKPEIAKVTEIIPTPKMPGGTVDPATFVSKGCGHGLVMYNKSFHDKDKQPALVALADFLSSDAFAEELLYKGGMVPAKNIKFDKTKLTIPMQAEVFEFAEGKECMTNHWLKFPDTKPWADAQNFLDELMAGGITPEQYIEKVQKSLDTAKAENK